ncbi:unnamed protein product [Linum trigynum]|uniref:Uncharacterized protein n=1 Tax=Linum trigynum TaxID=586398 RepID=A0AAV2F997_9ROSI
MNLIVRRRRDLVAVCYYDWRRRGRYATHDSGGGPIATASNGATMKGEVAVWILVVCEEDHCAVAIEAAKWSIGAEHRQLWLEKNGGERTTLSRMTTASWGGEIGWSKESWLVSYLCTGTTG